MTALRDITAEQLDRIDAILAEYKQTEDASQLAYQRQTRHGIDGARSQRKTGAVILSFEVPGKVVRGIFKHSFTINDDGGYTKKTTYKGVNHE
mgnify:CR=1 FL=1